MSYFDKLINEHFLEFDPYTHRVCIGRDELELICREYAIYMCYRQQENCAECAIITEEGYYDSNDDPAYRFVVDQDSILKASLPFDLQ